MWLVHHPGVRENCGYYRNNNTLICRCTICRAIATRNINEHLLTNQIPAELWYKIRKYALVQT